MSARIPAANCSSTYLRYSSLFRVLAAQQAESTPSASSPVSTELLGLQPFCSHPVERKKEKSSLRFLHEPSNMPYISSTKKVITCSHLTSRTTQRRSLSARGQNAWLSIGIMLRKGKRLNTGRKPGVSATIPQIANVSRPPQRTTIDFRSCHRPPPCTQPPRTGAPERAERRCGGHQARAPPCPAEGTQGSQHQRLRLVRSGGRVRP